MRRLSFVLPYYENPGMLAHQYEIWRDYPAALKASIEIVLVDDGSPEGPAIAVPRPAGLPSLSIYRVTVDIPWNQHGARNLGATKAEGPWLFLTDMDHVLPAESLAALMAIQNKGRIYTFARLDAPDLTPTLGRDGKPKPHPNTFAMTKDLYWQIGGYDEAYRGVYGTDSMFRARAFTAAPRVHLDDIPIHRYSRDVIADASTRTLPRKEARGDAKVQVQARKRLAGEADKIETLTFPWERLL